MKALLLVLANVASEAHHNAWRAASSWTVIKLQKTIRSDFLPDEGLSEIISFFPRLQLDRLKPTDRRMARLIHRLVNKPILPSNLSSVFIAAPLRIIHLVVVHAAEGRVTVWPIRESASNFQLASVDEFVALRKKSYAVLRHVLIELGPSAMAGKIMEIEELLTQGHTPESGQAPLNGLRYTMIENVSVAIADFIPFSSSPTTPNAIKQTDGEAESANYCHIEFHQELLLARHIEVDVSQKGAFRFPLPDLLLWLQLNNEGQEDGRWKSFRSDVYPFTEEPNQVLEVLCKAFYASGARCTYELLVYDTGERAPDTTFSAINYHTEEVLDSAVEAIDERESDGLRTRWQWTVRRRHLSRETLCPLDKEVIYDDWLYMTHSHGKKYGNFREGREQKIRRRVSDEVWWEEEN